VPRLAVIFVSVSWNSFIANSFSLCCRYYLGLQLSRVSSENPAPPLRHTRGYNSVMSGWVAPALASGPIATTSLATPLRFFSRSGSPPPRLSP
jgi:hypothetical protein